MHGGAHTGAGHPFQNKGTTDTVSSRSQLLSGPSVPGVSVPGVSGSSKTIHPIFRGNDDGDQVSPISGASSDVQLDAMEDVTRSVHSPATTCEFQIPYN